jgi:DNA-binding transcriptional MerR regulator
MDKLLTVEDVSKMASVCERTVHNWEKKGLKTIKFSKRCKRYTLEDVMAFIKNQYASN